MSVCLLSTYLVVNMSRLLSIGLVDNVARVLSI